MLVFQKQCQTINRPVSIVAKYNYSRKQYTTHARGSLKKFCHCYCI